MTDKKPLKLKPEEKYKGDIQPGDHVVFQCFANKTEEGMSHITILVAEVKEVDLEKGTFTSEQLLEGVPQPMYRIRYWVNKEKGTAMLYDGYDYHQIAVDEGEMNNIEEDVRDGDVRDGGEWVKVDLTINTRTGEIFARGGDREPCSHGKPPCCDTKYIGLEWLKARMIKRN
jgi:hypothetical protein